MTVIITNTPYKLNKVTQNNTDNVTRIRILAKKEENIIMIFECSSHIMCEQTLHIAISLIRSH